MATKQEILNDPDSDWNKAADDEHVFILRSSNQFAAYALRRYARQCRRHGMPIEEYKQIYALAKVMEHDERATYPFTPE